MSGRGTPTTRSVTAAAIGVSLDHPGLVHTDPGSIRAFLIKHDQYNHAVLACARQLTYGSLTTEAVTPIDLKYCVDVEFLQANIGLGFLEANPHDDLTDDFERAFLEEGGGESKEHINIYQLNKMLAAHLCTNMRNNNAAARMKDLFKSYYALHTRHGLL